MNVHVMIFPHIKVQIEGQNNNIIDEYRLKVGIRSVDWDSAGIKINGQPIYIKGVGKHEDSDVS